MIAPLLLLGRRAVIMPTAPFDAEETLDVVESEGVTGLFLVPAQWQILCAHPDTTRRTTSLRTISWGAAPASVALLEKMGATFPHAEIVSVFGQTEMSPVTTLLPSEDAVRKIGSVGKVIPTIAARVVDADALGRSRRARRHSGRFTALAAGHIDDRKLPRCRVSALQRLLRRQGATRGAGSRRRRRESPPLLRRSRAP